MKKSKIFLTLLIFNALQVIGQDAKLKMWIVDNKGRSDTIEFGVYKNATNGIDIALGEHNFYLTDLDSLDIRSIQRDEENHHCLNYEIFGHASNSPGIFFDTNRDLKKDYRSSKHNDSISFEIVFHVENFPANVYLDISEIGELDEKMTVLGKDNDCNIPLIYGTLIKSVYPEGPFLTLESQDTIINTIVFVPDLTIGLDETKESIDFKIYPTITSDQFNVEFFIPTENYSIVLFSLTGDKIYEKRLLNSFQSIDISNFSQGLYLIQIRNKNELIFNDLIIKN